MRLVYLFILGLIVAAFLFLRNCVDRKVEQVTGKEVVREDEEMLGTWATKSAETYIQLRLRRDGQLEYLLADLKAKDTTKIAGTYAVAGPNGRSASYFPRLYGLGTNGDTLFNFYIRYVTPYESTVDKYDRMVLSPNSVFDTIEYVFYRIKQ